VCREIIIDGIYTIISCDSKFIKNFDMTIVPRQKFAVILPMETRQEDMQKSQISVTSSAYKHKGKNIQPKEL